MTNRDNQPAFSRRATLRLGAGLGGLGLLGYAGLHAYGHRGLSGAPIAGGTPFLTPGQRQTLQAVFEALLPDDAPVSEMVADVDRFLAGDDPVLAGDLAAALTLFEHAGGVGPAAFVRFSRRDRADRVQIVEAWRAGRFAVQRQIGAALFKVALFTCYTRPDGWARLGYDGPWVQR